MCNLWKMLHFRTFCVFGKISLKNWTYETNLFTLQRCKKKKSPTHVINLIYTWYIWCTLIHHRCTLDTLLIYTWYNNNIHFDILDTPVIYTWYKWYQFNRHLIYMIYSTLYKLDIPNICIYDKKLWIFVKGCGKKNIN